MCVLIRLLKHKVANHNKIMLTKLADKLPCHTCTIYFVTGVLLISVKQKIGISNMFRLSSSMKLTVTMYLLSVYLLLLCDNSEYTIQNPFGCDNSGRSWRKKIIYKPRITSKQSLCVCMWYIDRKSAASFVHSGKITNQVEATFC